MVLLYNYEIVLKIKCEKKLAKLSEAFILA